MGVREDCDDIRMAVEAKNDDGECEQGPKVESEQPDVLKGSLSLRGDVPGPHHYGDGCVDEPYHRRHTHLQFAKY